MRIAGAVLAVLAVGIFAFWYGWVKAPSAQALCDHKIDLVRAEAEDRDAEPLIELLRQTCVDNAQRRVQMRGKLKYAVYARCVVKSKTLAESERCSSVARKADGS